MTFNIPSHGYELTLADGSEVIMDTCVEAHRKAVVRVFDDTVGWETRKVVTVIDDVYDCETETHLDPLEWAKDCVWPFNPVTEPKAKSKPKAKYRIHFHYNKPMPPEEFSSKAKVMEWIMDGMRSTEGAERDHYVDLLVQLESGKKELNYN